ncbi:MAG: hypothetical protein CMC05_09615 [Flavobacteriaceae bacterium]|nr:hypothetical protein [Flavobacteriaceae bacterium]MBD09392.1 hypothetical protein [Flavobacteriaceae bacterium]|tara:strand:+ start:235 stop:582 length:348 start_codon:yes stop_codon:yes gene_type:complete
MKKIITLGLFVFAMFLGTGSLMAQSNKIEVNKKASEKTEELVKLTKCDNNQKDQIYLALQEFTQATLDLKNATVVKEDAVKKIKTLLDSKMQDILNEAQYESYKTYFEENLKNLQ